MLNHDGTTTPAPKTDARRSHHYEMLAADAAPRAEATELAVDVSWRRFGYSAPELAEATR